jgi:hypothetical protein
METFNYMLITEENGLGEKQYKAHLICPWYKGGNFSICWMTTPSCFLIDTWSNKDELIAAIKSDAKYRRQQPLKKYKVVLKEPIKA